MKEYRSYVAWLLGTAAATIALAATFSVIVDPFGLLGNATWPSGEQDIAYLINRPLTRIADLRTSDDSSVNLIIGDSRADQFSVHDWNELSGEKWLNLGFGGATLEEMQSMLDYALQRGTPRRVVVVLPFNRFRRSFAVNTVLEAINLARRPAALFTGVSCLDASFEVLANSIAGIHFRSAAPRMTADKFEQLQYAREVEYDYSADGLNYAEDIVRQMQVRARGAGSRLAFLAPPAQDRLLALYAGKFHEPFFNVKDYMRRNTFFLDYENTDATQNLQTRLQFKDLVHLTPESSRKVVAAGWGQIRSEAD